MKTLCQHIDRALSRHFNKEAFEFLQQFKGDKLPALPDTPTSNVFVHGTRDHPNMVILVQIGGFLETNGLSAITLMAVCSVRNMGGTCKAGVPIGSSANRLMRTLVSNGIGVAVFLQKPCGKIYKRPLTFVVSPANPTFPPSSYDNSEEEIGEEFEESVVAIDPKMVVVVLKCSTLLILNLQTLTRTVMCDLEKEVVESYLSSCSEDIYQVFRLNEESDLKKTVYPMHGLPLDTVFTKDCVPTRQPLSKSLTGQIGLQIRTPFESYTKNLLNILLGEKTISVLKNCLFKLLVSNVDSSRRDSIRSVLCEIHTGQRIVSKMCTTKTAGEIVASLLHLQLPHPSVLKTIRSVCVVEGPKLTTNVLKSINGQTEQLENVKQWCEKTVVPILKDLKNEKTVYSKNEVVNEYVLAQLSKVQFEVDVSAAVSILEQNVDNVVTTIKPSPTFILTHIDGKICLHKASKSAFKPAYCLIMSTDKGKEIKNQFTTLELSQAISVFEDYVSELKLADDAKVSETVKVLLFERDYLKWMLEVPIFVMTLHTHLANLVPVGWSFGKISSEKIEAAGLFPYHLTLKTSTSNNIALDLHTTTLLTAPNAAGKSTLIRTLLVSCLLNNAGLLVPSSEGFHSPFFESFHLRLPGTDRPIEGLSCFESEVKDLSNLLKTVNQDSIVFIDEIGRGTCNLESIAFNSSLLEYMGARKITTLLSTHVHELLDVFPQLPRLTSSHSYIVSKGENRSSDAVMVCEKFKFPITIISKMKELLKTPFLSEEVFENDFDHANSIAYRMFGMLCQASVGKDEVLPTCVLDSPASLYIIEEEDQRIYIGETSNALRRMGEHLMRGKQVEKINVYVCENKTMSFEREARLQQLCMKTTIKLSSTCDSHHKI